MKLDKASKVQLCSYECDSWFWGVTQCVPLQHSSLNVVLFNGFPFPPFQVPTKGATAELVGAVKGILGTFLRQTGIVVLNFHLRKVTREVLKELLRSKKRSLKEGTLAWENFCKDRRKFWAFYWTFLRYFKLAQDELTYFWLYHRISPPPQMVKVLWNPIGWNQKGEFFSRPYLYVDK